MKSTRPLLIVVGVVIVLLCIKVAINIADRPDDALLIRHALDDAIRASRDGRPGGVMDLLSENLKFNGTDVGVRSSQIRDFIRRQRPEIAVANPAPVVTGDRAHIISPVELDFGLIGKRTIPDVTMIFRKEDATEYLIIPIHKWRLTQVTVPDAEIAALVSGAGQ